MSRWRNMRRRLADWRKSRRERRERRERLKIIGGWRRGRAEGEGD